MLNISAAKIGYSKIHSVEHFLLTIVEAGMNSSCSTPDAGRVSTRSYDSGFRESSKRFIQVAPAPHPDANVEIFSI